VTDASTLMQECLIWSSWQGSKPALTRQQISDWNGRKFLALENEKDTEGISTAENAVPKMHQKGNKNVGKL